MSYLILTLMISLNFQNVHKTNTRIIQPLNHRAKSTEIITFHFDFDFRLLIKLENYF